MWYLGAKAQVCGVGSQMVSEFHYQIDKMTKMGNVVLLFASNHDLFRIELCMNDWFSL